MQAYIRLFSLGVVLAILAQACGDGRPRQAIGEINMFEDEQLRTLYSAADARDVEGILPFASHEVAAYRRAFARLVGSMPDTALYKPLSKLVNDPVPYVRLEASWAIGQYRDTLPLEVLETAIRKATIPEIKAELLEAIGKCAHARAMAFLIRHEPGTPVEEAGKMWGIYRASLRGLLLEPHLRIVAAHLRSREADTRLAAIHTLARQELHPLDAHAEAIMQAASTDPSPEVRQMAVKALRHTSTGDGFLASLLQNEAEPAVRAAVMEAFRHPAKMPARDVLTDALEDGSPWVTMTAAARLPEVNADLDMGMLRGLALGTRIPEVRSAALIQAFQQHSSSDAWALYAQLRTQHPQPAQQRILISALAWHEPALDTLLALLNAPQDANGPDQTPAVNTAAAQALVSGASRYSSWQDALPQAIAAALRTGQAGAVATFAEALLNNPLQQGMLPDSALLRQATNRFTQAGEHEVRQALLKVYAHMRGLPYAYSPPAPNQPINWEQVAAIPRGTRARIHSKEGVVELQLLIEDAPGSVAQFVAHAYSGYYSGLSVHRVVPGFVSQGGCPVGDGYHSTSHSLRSELSALRFGKGVAGLASAGPDTEGPQFFITHTSTPHLDGRYTIIGALSSGWESLTLWNTGTVIDSVSIHMP